jgi:hypothetical protein
MLLLTAVLIVRRVLGRPAVTIQGICGALSAYLVTGLMVAACYAALQHLSRAPFFADGQPASTQTFQYFSFTTLTTLGVWGLHRGGRRRPRGRRPGSPDRPGVPGHAGGAPRLRVPHDSPAGHPGAWPLPAASSARCQDRFLTVTARRATAGGR